MENNKFPDSQDESWGGLFGSPHSSPLEFNSAPSSPAKPRGSQSPWSSPCGTRGSLTDYVGKKTKTKRIGGWIPPSLFVEGQESSINMTTTTQTCVTDSIASVGDKENCNPNTPFLPKKEESETTSVPALPSSMAVTSQLSLTLQEQPTYGDCQSFILLSRTMKFKFQLLLPTHLAGVPIHFKVIHTLNDVVFERRHITVDHSEAGQRTKKRKQNATDSYCEREGQLLTVHFDGMEPSKMAIFRFRFEVSASNAEGSDQQRLSSSRPEIFAATSFPCIIYAHITNQKDKALRSLLSDIYPVPSQLTRESWINCFKTISPQCEQDAFLSIPSIFRAPSELWDWFQQCDNIIKGCNIFQMGYMYGYQPMGYVETLLLREGKEGLFLIWLNEDANLVVSLLTLQQQPEKKVLHVLIKSADMEGIQQALVCPFFNEVLCRDGHSLPKSVLLNMPRKSSKYITTADLYQRYFDSISKNM